VAPPETLEEALPAMDAALSIADQAAADPPPEPPEVEPAPASPSRNTRNNPVLPDDEFMLELPGYNPLLE
jgi:hypothetical protein